ncbi:MAG: hypothetical protein II747_03800, partial [Clostridia bacterium]|nr:hypothetical protein [Clostridia bacterium]
NELNELIPVLREGVKVLIVRGAVTDSTASALRNIGKLLKNTLIVAEDASRLLLKPVMFEKLLGFTRGVSVLKGTRLAAVTVNPFSAYGTHYNKYEFKERVEEALRMAEVDVPVMDVKYV